jgi:hypothetical protein
MAFADPQSVTINGVAISMPRIASGVGTGKFQAADTNTVLSVAHQSGKRVRHQIRIDSSKIAADILTPDVNQKFSMSAYLVVDVPVYGFVIADQALVVNGFLSYLTASSGAKVTQLLGGEN